MSDLTPHDLTPENRDARTNVDVTVEANSDAVMVASVCIAACVGILTLGAVRIAGQPDGANKLRALMPWGHKVKPARVASPAVPSAAIK